MFVSCSPKEPVPNGNSQTSEVKKTVCQKRALEDSDGAGETLSRNKQKKRSRNPNKNFSPEQKRELKKDQAVKKVPVETCQNDLNTVLRFSCSQIHQV